MNFLLVLVMAIMGAYALPNSPQSESVPSQNNDRNENRWGSLNTNSKDRWSSINTDNFRFNGGLGQNWGQSGRFSLNTNTGARGSSKTNSGWNIAGSDRIADRISSFDLSSFGGATGQSSNWNSGDSNAAVAGVSSKSVGQNSRVITASSSRFDLSGGASSKGSSVRIGDFGESAIDLGLFTGSKGGSGQRSRGAYGNAGDNYDLGGSGPSVRVNARERGFGNGGFSGSVSSAGARLSRNNQQNYY